MKGKGNKGEKTSCFILGLSKHIKVFHALRISLIISNADEDVTAVSEISDTTCRLDKPPREIIIPFPRTPNNIEF